MIRGFIITGTAPKKIIVRALGPALVDASLPATETLADPSLELHNSGGAIIARNETGRKPRPRKFPPLAWRPRKIWNRRS